MVEYEERKSTAWITLDFTHLRERAFLARYPSYLLREVS